MMISPHFKPHSSAGKGQALVLKPQVQSQFGHIGHHHDDCPEEKPLLKAESENQENKKTEAKKKSGSPWKLWLWGAADVTMMAGSVFMADMIVPEHHHDHDHDAPTVQTPLTPEQKVEQDKEEKAAWWRHALELSGIATGLHMLSHVGLAGGWYLYGRSRGKGKHEEDLKDFKKVKHQLKMLEKDGANFVLVETAPGEFVLKAKAAPTPKAEPIQLSQPEKAKSEEKPQEVEKPKTSEPQ
jgi:hypothetical protein